MYEFLQELATLCKKYKMKLAGCGCCDCPWIKNEDGVEVGNVSVTATGNLTAEPYWDDVGETEFRYEIQA